MASDTPAAQAVKQATKTVPIVFIGGGDPVTSGLVGGLGRRGGNVTGMSLLAPELVGKRLNTSSRPFQACRAAMLWQPGGSGGHTETDMLKEMEIAARTLGVRLQFVEARGLADFDRAFSVRSAVKRAAGVTEFCECQDPVRGVTPRDRHGLGRRDGAWRQQGREEPSWLLRSGQGTHEIFRESFVPVRPRYLGICRPGQCQR